MRSTPAHQLLRWMEAVFGANAIALVLNFYTGVLTARALGPAGKGIYNAITVWTVVFGGLVLVGLPQALIARYGRADDAEERGRILGGAYLLAFVWGLVGDLCALVVLPRLIGHLGPAAVRWGEIMLATIPLGSLAQVGLALLTVEHAFGRYSLFRISQVVLVAVPLTVVAAAGALTPYTYVAVIFANNLVFSLVPLVLVQRLIKARRVRIGAASWRQLINLSGVGLRFYAIGLAAVFNAQLDQMLATTLLSATDIGLYAVAISSVTVVGSIASAFRAVYYPATVRDDPEAVTRRTAAAARGGAWLLATAGLLMAALAGPALHLLYGARYVPAWPVVVALVPAAVFTGLLTVLYQGCYSLRLLDVPLVGEIIGAVSGAALLLVLIPRLGIFGAGLAGSVSYALDFAAVVYLWRRRVNVPFSLLPTWADLRRVALLVGAEARQALNVISGRGRPRRAGDIKTGSA